MIWCYCTYSVLSTVANILHSWTVSLILVMETGKVSFNAEKEIRIFILQIIILHSISLMFICLSNQ